MRFHQSQVGWLVATGFSLSVEESIERNSNEGVRPHERGKFSPDAGQYSGAGERSHCNRRYDEAERLIQRLLAKEETKPEDKSAI